MLKAGFYLHSLFNLVLAHGPIPQSSTADAITDSETELGRCWSNAPRGCASLFWGEGQGFFFF